MMYCIMTYIDTHSHIQFKAFDEDRTAVIERCKKENIIANVVGTQKNTSKKAVELAEQHEHLFASIGTHPIHLFPTRVDEEEDHFVSRDEDFDWDYYSQLAQSSKVIAVGETGIDLFHLPKDKSAEEVLEKQTKVFLDHVRFAQEHDLPLVIHCRDAHDQLIALLKKLNRKINGTIHCFTSHWEHAEQYLDMGFHLGFTGVVTFPAKKTDPKPQEELLDVLQKMPLERMLIETDSPYLAPQAYRGKRCEPWMVGEVSSFIATLRKLPEAQLAEQIEKNTRALFTKLP